MTPYNELVLQGPLTEEDQKVFDGLARFVGPNSRLLELLHEKALAESYKGTELGDTAIRNLLRRNFALFALNS